MKPDKLKERKGKPIELGLIPCRVCNERHVLMDYGKDVASSWIMNGHPYQEIEARTYIQTQRDQINKLLRIKRRLESQIFKLKKRILTGK